MAESSYGKAAKKLAEKFQNLNLLGAKKETEISAEEGEEVELADGEKAPAAKQPAKSKGIPIGKIMVDLTPDVYKDAVKVREARKQWIFINAGIVAVSALVLGILFATTIGPKMRLDGLIESNAGIEAQLTQYQDLNIALEQMSVVQDKLNTAAGNEINWDQLISALEATLPSGVSMTSIGINAASSTPEVGANILISFVATSPLGYADTLRSVQSATGVSNVQIGGMTSSGDNYSYSATLTYDGSIKTERFKTSDEILLGNDGGTGGAEQLVPGPEDAPLPPIFSDPSNPFGSGDNPFVQQQPQDDPLSGETDQPITDGGDLDTTDSAQGGN